LVDLIVSKALEEIAGSLWERKDIECYLERELYLPSMYEYA
jgi:hypothetical protein